MKGFFKDFKKFISRGNILDMAVGVIIGGAFSAIVTSFTNKIIMPVINWILAIIVGGDGLSSVYTFLKKAYTTVDGVETIDLANSIYIDWGAFLTAILDFLIIAFVLFSILRLVMKTQGYLDKAKKAKPTKEEKKTLKAQGVDMKDYKAVLVATAELREKNKPAPTPAKPTQEELLTEILAELKKQNVEKKETKTKKQKNEEE